MSLSDKQLANGGTGQGVVLQGSVFYPPAIPYPRAGGLIQPSADKYSIMAEASHTVRIVEAENGYILEFMSSSSNSTTKKYICANVDELKDRIVACLVGNRLEGKSK